MTSGFDLVLGTALLACAIGALASRELFRAIVMFIVFGLLMALAWVRLHAPDIALAEAAIGAGLTGVLLLDTLGYLRRRFEHPRTHAHAHDPGRKPGRKPARKNSPPTPGPQERP
jgi:uncharacterized MnhB-related membrane protein